MIKQGTNLFRKKLLSNISHHLVNYSNQPKRSEFSTICHKQFNANTNSLSKEQFADTVRGLNKIMSSSVSITPHEFSVIDQVIANHRTQHPKDPLPKQMLITLAKSMDHYYSFYSITSDVLEINKRHGIIDNVEEMKRFAISNLLKWSHLNGILLKAVFQEWFSFDDVKVILPEAQTNIEIEGKDIIFHDQVNYYSALMIFSMDNSWNVKHLPTKDSLIGLVSFICFYLSITNEHELLLSKMRQFVEMYPMVKELYTTPYGGDVAKSWTSELEKVYTEDEFDWFFDMETDLPIHLGGFYNICKEIMKMVETGSKEGLVKVLQEESVRSPNNPYIPFFKFCVCSDLAAIDECLNILKQSNSQPRFEDLKRIELFGIFKNQKPAQPRIKDFKFFPLLALKVKNLQGNSRMLLEQVESYSRLPSHVELISIKFEACVRDGRFEEALQNYQSLSYFEKGISPNSMLRLTYLAVKPMIVMGFYNQCIEVIERFKNKYTGDPAWEQLLEKAKEEIEKSKSK